MFASLLIPLPVLAAQWTLSITTEVIVHERGRVVAPRSLRGIPAERAAQLFPASKVVPRRPDWEHAAWDRIVEEVWTWTPYIVSEQPGRLLCTPDSMPHLRTLVERTRAQCGLASTRTLSVLAALAASDGGIMTVPSDESARFLDALPVSTLQALDELHIDDQTLERLDLFGLRTVGRLRMLTRHHLHLQFGDVGLHIHDLLRTIGDARPLPLYQPAPSITETETFTDGVNEPSVITDAIERCAERAITHLAGRTTQRLDVAVLDRADAVTQRRTRILKQPLSMLAPMKAQLHALIAPMVGPKLYHWGVQLRLATLRHPPSEQLPLFRPRPTLDEINAPLSTRYPAAIKRISIVDPFAYLPERFARLEAWRSSL